MTSDQTARIRRRLAPRLAVCAALIAGAPVAAAATRSDPIQESATSVRPTPAQAEADRSQAYTDGCHLPKRATRSPACAYGDTQSATTVVLFGDSHALHFFPALLQVAIDRGWRLVILTKSGCSPADVKSYRGDGHQAYRECLVWRRAIVHRIETQEKPALVVTGNSDRAAILGPGGRPLHGLARLRELARGYAATVKRFVRGGAKVVAMRDIPRPPFDIPPCVAKAMRHLRRCAFAERPARLHPDPALSGLRRIPGARVLDAGGRLCVGGLCPAVIDDMLVYRSGGHLTATFAATLAPWLGRELAGLA